MGVKERRARQKQNLRQEILDAARDLFVSEGYQNVSMRKIAERIEYSPTTIYLYFKDKAELLNSLCDETFAQMVATFEELQAEGGDPVDCLRKGMRAYVAFGLRYPNHYLLTFMIPIPDKETKDPEAMGFKAFAFLPMLVGDCVQEGRFRQVDVVAASQALWAAVHGLVALLICHEDFPWVDREQLVEQLIDIQITGLKA